MEPPASASRPGDRVGEFELLRLIGRGGMGEVWEARQRSVDRRVALKLLPIALAHEPRAVLRFHREAQAGARLSHPGIATVYSAGLADERLYIAQELVRGKSLAEWVRTLPREEPLPPEHFTEVARIVREVAQALHYAHGQGVVHRDVKPQNVLLARNGQPKLVDFGLALTEDAFTLSRSGEVAGTYAYMSPEQARARSTEVDHRTDVFSLGATLYELLTLARPFEGDSVYELTDKILHEAPRHPCRRRPEVPAGLARACLRALEKDKARRPASMLEFAASLGEGGEQAAPERTRVDRRRTVVAAVVLVPLLALGTLLLLHGRSPTGRAAGREPGRSAEESLSLGRELVASPATRTEGLAHLRAARALDPELPEVELHLCRALGAAVSERLDAGRPLEAVPLAQELSRVATLSADLALVARAVEAARAAVHGALTITSPAPGAVLREGRVTLTGKLDGVPAGTGLLLQGQPLELVEGRFLRALGPFGDGRQELALVVCLAEGLEEPFPFAFVVDSTPPELTIHAPRDGDFVRPSFLLRGSVRDLGATWITCGAQRMAPDDPGDWELALTAEGPDAELVVVAEDEAGHSTPVRLRLVVDDAPPTIEGATDGEEIASRLGEAELRVRIRDERALDTVTWNGLGVEPDAEGGVTLRAAGHPDEDQTKTHLLVARDRAGNETVLRIHSRWDRTPPQVEHPAEGEAFPGSVFPLKGRIVDRSPCTVSMGSVSVLVPPGGDFELPVPVTVLAGARQPVHFLVRDAAGNEQARTASLTALHPCPTCEPVEGARGACTACKGNGRVTLDCAVASCRAGVLTEPCTGCAGSGKATCLACGGKGEVRPAILCEACDDGWISCATCSGDGQVSVSCKRCKGEGKIRNHSLGPSKVDCPDCVKGWASAMCEACGGEKRTRHCTSGILQFPCSACVKGRTTAACQACAGRGRSVRTCDACAGVGSQSTDCPTCGGTGRCRACSGTGSAPWR